DEKNGEKERVDLRDAIWCPKRCGGVCWIPSEENPLTRCNKCRTAVKDTDAVLDALNVGQQALDKAEALQFSDPQKSIQLCTKLIPILVSAGFVPSAHPLLGLSRLESALLIREVGEAMASNDMSGGFGERGEDAMDVDDVAPSSTSASASATPTSPSTSTSPSTTPTSTPTQAQLNLQSKLDNAIRSATRTVSGLCEILSQGHPQRGIALAELGKLLCVDEVVDMERYRGGEGNKIGGGSGIPSPSTSSSSLNLSSFANLPPNPNPNAQYPPSGPARLSLALRTLLRARAELMIGFGRANEGGEVGEEVREAVVRVERELGMWREGVRRGVR
ncbi:hypothetical protein CVT24_007785, partial [Panaeolus cyanescens]